MRAHRMLELSPFVTEAKAPAPSMFARARSSRSNPKPTTRVPLKAGVSRRNARSFLSTMATEWPASSSTAYATEEILFVIAVAPSSLALGLSKLVPIAITVAILLAIVATSYRQTIFAYPSGGGSYIVSRENLGEMPSLVAGASLLVDYILTVAVSISSGVAAIISIPRFQGLADKRVLVCLLLVALVTIMNLRGVKESG